MLADLATQSYQTSLALSSIFNTTKLWRKAQRKYPNTGISWKILENIWHVISYYIDWKITRNARISLIEISFNVKWKFPLLLSLSFAHCFSNNNILQNHLECPNYFHSIDVSCLIAVWQQLPQLFCSPMTLETVTAMALKLCQVHNSKVGQPHHQHQQQQL